MEGVPLPPGILNPGGPGSLDPLEAVLGPFPCARLQNLPYDTSVEDIILLFQGLVVIDVLLVQQGEAFVVFANPMDFHMALQRSDRQTIGRRFIKIEAATRNDYYQAIAQQYIREQNTSAGPSMVRSGSAGLEPDDEHGHPTSSDVSNLWGGAPAGIPMQGQQTHMYAEASMAAQPYHGMHPGMAMPGRGAMPSGPSGPGRGGMGTPVLPKRTGGGIQIGEHTGFLRMRGLPFSASRDDIYRFFTGYNPVPESIVLTYRNDGRATGEAYVGFNTPDDARRAMELNRRMMGSRYIELFISNREEQGRALVRFGSR